MLDFLAIHDFIFFPMVFVSNAVFFSLRLPS